MLPSSIKPSTLPVSEEQTAATIPFSTTSMCKKYGVQVFIVSTPQDIAPSNDKFQKLFKIFNQDVYSPQTIISHDNNGNSSSSASSARLPLVIGIDVEWGQSESPAVIQIASRRASFVVIVARDPTLLEPFRAVLADKDVVKAGVGVRSDKQKIEMINQYQVHGEVDLAAIVCRTPEANQVVNLSLARITAFYCGHSLNKDLSIVCSDWASEVLSDEQLEYAADDSVAGLLSFDAIMKKHINAGTIKAQPTLVSAVAVKPQLPSQTNENINNNKNNDDDDDGESDQQIVEVTSTLLAPGSPSGFYANASINEGDDNTAVVDGSPASIHPSSQPTFEVLARVQRTPMEWAKKYIRRKVILKQPKNNKQQNGAHSKSAPAAGNENDINSNQDPSHGIIARFETRMEKRYQTVSEAQDSIHRISTSGVQAVGPDDANLFCLDAFKAAWYVKKGIAAALEYVDDDPTKQLRRIQLNFTPNIKTKVCRTFSIFGRCPNENCPFAHGSADLRESIRDETKEINASITAKQLSQRSLRTRCDMCRAQNAGINNLTCVPGPWLRLMGEEVADESGCSIGLHLCCKCQALMRAVFVSERRLLRNNAAAFFVENELYFGRRKNGDDEDDDEDNDSTINRERTKNSSIADDEDEDIDEGDGAQQKMKKNNKHGPEPEGNLLAKVNEASMTRMCSLCQLIVSQKRSNGVPFQRIKQIVTRINIFYDMLVKEGILLGRVAPLPPNDPERQSTETESSHDDKNAIAQENPRDDHLENDDEVKFFFTSQIHERALHIAEQINQFSKGDWLASAEARDIARYFCLRPVDEVRERPAGIVTPQEEEVFIHTLANKLRSEKSLDSLRVAEPQYSVFWAKRMFEYYRTIFEKQLRPVIIPWKGFCREPPVVENK